MADSIDRRSFLAAGLAGGLVLAAAPARALMPTPRPVRRLAMHNLHTGESLQAVYWEHGQYLPDALAAIDHLLRDHRSGEVHPIDPGVLDILHRLQFVLEAPAPFQIISGYRSPKTNAALRAQGRGVAKRSLHMQGRAIDIRVPGRAAETVARAARSLKAGGVGTYSRSNFVHVDTGRVRYW